MRIISGFARGRRLQTPPSGSLSIRPTADRAREGIFNILGDKVRNATVLDLFAGTGAFGLEAFSRGASYVILVDNNQVSLQLLQKNSMKCLQGYHGPGELRLVQHDLQKPLSSSLLPENMTGNFDIIFADPPYDKKLSLKVLNHIDASDLLHKNGMAIIEERKNVTLPEQFSSLYCLDKRIYGEAVFCFYRHINHTAPNTL